MLLKAFEIALLCMFTLLLVARVATAVTFEAGYDEAIIAGLAFSVGMIVREIMCKD